MHSNNLDDCIIAENVKSKQLLPTGELSAPSNCCFNITKFNTPGVIRASCTNGTITTEIVDVQSADIGEIFKVIAYAIF